MDYSPHRPPQPVLDFLRESHLATLTTVDASGGLQVTPVGVTFDSADSPVARVITWATSAKALNIARRPNQRVALCQVDGGRWLAMHGPAVVSDQTERVADAVRRYTERYRTPSERDDRVVIEISVERMLGRT